MEIRSYRRVFDLERRIYRVDRLRLNPGGVPVLAVVYFLAAVAIALLASRLPLLDVPMLAAPWYLRYLALPALLAALLAILRIEGRSFHLAAWSLLRSRLRPSRLAGLQRLRPRLAPAGIGGWRPEPILMLPNGSEAVARRLDYTGPGALLIGVAYERESRRGPLVWLGLRSHVSVRRLPQAPRPERGEVLVLERATRVQVS